MDYVVGGRKRYVMDVHLGESTSTYDAEGEVTAVRDTAAITLAAIESALEGFIGLVEQVPPMYSAVKVDGQRLYKLARAGIEVDREPRSVDIYSIELTNLELPDLTLDVECGKGVYMRTLAHDLGEILGCGAHVTDLERRACSSFTAAEGVTLEKLADSAETPEGWQQYLHPVDWVVKEFKSITVGQAAERHLRNGQTISIGVSSITAEYLEEFRAYNSEGQFLALVRFDRAGNLWRPVKVFQSDTTSPIAPFPA